VIRDQIITAVVQLPKLMPPFLVNEGILVETHRPDAPRASLQRSVVVDARSCPPLPASPEPDILVASRFVEA